MSHVIKGESQATMWWALLGKSVWNQRLQYSFSRTCQQMVNTGIYTALSNQDSVQP